MEEYGRKRKQQTRKKTPGQDRDIRRLRFKTAVDLHREITINGTIRLSVRSIRIRLAKFGLRGHVARRKQLVSSWNRTARVRFAREHLRWEAEDWEKCYFKTNRSSTDSDLTECAMFVNVSMRNSIPTAHNALSKEDEIRLLGGNAQARARANTSKLRKHGPTLVCGHPEKCDESVRSQGNGKSLFSSITGAVQPHIV